jgi:hypothetical protein
VNRVDRHLVVGLDVLYPSEVALGGVARQGDLGSI